MDLSCSTLFVYSFNKHYLCPLPSEGKQKQVNQPLLGKKQ